MGIGAADGAVEEDSAFGVMRMLHDVIEVKPLKNHRLHVRFDDGVEGKIDVIRLIDFKGIFASLKDPKRFAEVFSQSRTWDCVLA